MKGSSRALLLWKEVPQEIRDRELSNIWCSHCKRKTGILDPRVVVIDGKLVINGGGCINCLRDIDHECKMD